MNYLIVSLSNENGVVEADLAASEDGWHPLEPSYHVVLPGPPVRLALMCPVVAIRCVAAALVELMKCEEPFIRAEAVGAWNLVSQVSRSGEVVVKFDAGVHPDIFVDGVIDAGRAAAKYREVQHPSGLMIRGQWFGGERPEAVAYAEHTNRTVVTINKGHGYWVVGADMLNELQQAKVWYRSHHMARRCNGGGTIASARWDGI